MTSSTVGSEPVSTESEHAASEHAASEHAASEHATGLRQPDDGGGLLSPALRATTVGVLALVSLHAFEAMALTTVMPTIARELDGAALYAMAFTATLAAGIVSIVWSGNLADRRGPRPPLLLGLVLFALGLVLFLVALATNLVAESLIRREKRSFTL